MDHQHREQIGKHGGGDIAQEHFHDILPHRLKIHASLGGDGVDGISGILRSEKRELIGNKRQRDGKQKQRPMLHDIAAETEHHALRRPAVELFLGAHLVRIRFRTRILCKIPLIQQKHLPSAIRRSLYIPHRFP